MRNREKVQGLGSFVHESGHWKRVQVLQIIFILRNIKIHRILMKALDQFYKVPNRLNTYGPKAWYEADVALARSAH